MTTEAVYRQSTIVTDPPSGYPVTLAQAKAQLSMESGDTSKDTLLNGYIAAAYRYVENALGYPVLFQERATYLRGFPSDGIWIGPGHGLEVVSVEYLDSDGATQTLDTAEYVVDAASRPCRVELASGSSWPSTRSGSNAVIVTWTAGWEDGDDVLLYAPELVHAMLMLVSHWDSHREAVLVGSISKEIDLAVEALLSSYRVQVL